MKIFTLFLILSLQYSIVNAQAPNWQWAKQMAGTSSPGKGVCTNASGNVYSTGNFYGTVDFDPGASTYNLSGTGADDGFISKLDSNGNFVWAKAFNGAGGMLGLDIATDASGNVYSTGIFNGTSDFDPGAGTFNLSATGSQDIYISKLDNAGNFVWADVLNGTATNSNFVSSIALDPTTGDVYTTGWFYGTVDFDPGSGVFNLTSNGASDIFISKLDNAGNFLWTKNIGGAAEDRGFPIVIDNAGMVYSAGGYLDSVDFDPGPDTYNLAPVDSADMYILKLDASGNFISATTIGGAGFEYIEDLEIDIVNGDVYAAGSFDGTVDFDPGVGTFNLTSNGQWDSFIFKLNSSGNFEWAKSIGGTSGESLSSLALDRISASSGVYAVGGFSGTVDFDPGTNSYNLSSAGDADSYLLKLDVDSGNFIWAKSFGGVNDDIAEDILVDQNGYTYLCGYFYSPAISFVTTTGTTTFTNPSGSSNAFLAKLDNLLTGMESVESTNTLSIYPNPANDRLVIRYPNILSKDARVNIMDFTGKIIYTTTPLQTEKIEVNTDNLADGVYFVQIQTTYFSETRKFIVTNK